jgi:hypothetical protein
MFILIKFYGLSSSNIIQQYSGLFACSRRFAAGYRFHPAALQQ